MIHFCFVSNSPKSKTPNGGFHHCISQIPAVPRDIAEDARVKEVTKVQQDRRLSYYCRDSANANITVYKGSLLTGPAVAL